ncbi:MAG: DUF192 domain-containing protein [Betaproteobacteria bacterium]|nr:DUF192 domain-containing protein [Betaproteobacteria bacterium]
MAYSTRNTLFNALRRLLLASSALALCGLALAQKPQTELPRTALTIGMYRIDAQVATTSAEHATGLMFRTEMPQHEGMLFVFEQPTQQCFWMKNTLIPLAVAFVADDGTLVNLDEMKAQTLNAHCSEKPVRYVLEMNASWFSKKGLKAGDKLKGPPFDAAKP